MAVDPDAPKIAVQTVDLFVSILAPRPATWRCASTPGAGSTSAAASHKKSSIAGVKKMKENRTLDVCPPQRIGEQINAPATACAAAERK
jgi:hypothetical protein